VTSVSLRRTLVVVFSGAALLFVGLTLKGQWTSLDQVLASTRSFPWSFDASWLALAAGIGVLDLLVMGSIWAFVFRRTGGRAGFPEAIRVWVITNFGRYIPGKIWQLGGLAAYMKGRGDSSAAALVSALAFQVITVVSGGAVAMATIGVRRVTGSEGWMPALVAGGVLLFAGLHPAVIRWIAGRLGNWFGEAEPEVDLAVADVVRAAAGMLVAWSLYGAGLLFLLRGVGIEVELARLPVLTGIFAASYVVGYLVLVAPGGLLVREGAMAALLAELMGLSIGVASAVAIMARLWVVVTELVTLFVVVSRPGSAGPAKGDSE